MEGAPTRLAALSGKYRYSSSKVSRLFRRKHLRPSGGAPGVQANFALAAVSFLCFVSFLSRERKEMKNDRSSAGNHPA